MKIISLVLLLLVCSIGIVSAKEHRIVSTINCNTDKAGICNVSIVMVGNNIFQHSANCNKKVYKGQNLIYESKDNSYTFEGFVSISDGVPWIGVDIIIKDLKPFTKHTLVLDCKGA